jgi:prefoldin subunit 5
MWVSTQHGEQTAVFAVVDREHRPDTSRVTLDIGLELHLEMGAGEAIEYAEKRAGVLEK